MNFFWNKFYHIGAGEYTRDAIVNVTIASLYEIVIKYSLGKLLNHQRLVEFSTTNDWKNEKSSDANEINDADCDDEDDETNVDDDEDDGDADDDNTILMKRQTTNLKKNEPIITDHNRNESIVTPDETIGDAMVAHDIGEQTKVKCTEEQQIKRLRKRKRRRRRRRRRRKSIANQITFAVNKEASFNINAERVRPQSSLAADELQGTTSNSFGSQKHNANMGLRVRRAILWIKVDAINRNGQYKKWTKARRLKANTKKQFTLWVFHIVEPYCKRRSHSRRVMCCKKNMKYYVQSVRCSQSNRFHSNGMPALG